MRPVGIFLILELLKTRDSPKRKVVLLDFLLYYVIIKIIKGLTVFREWRIIC